MRLFEYEAKELLKSCGIAIPRGKVVSTPQQAEAVAAEFGIPVMVKCQILLGRRGKAGGIIPADSPSEAKAAAESLLGCTIRGCMVGSLLIEEKLDIAEHFYLSVTVDRQARSYVLLVSTAGGVDIEEAARTAPEKIRRHRIDPVGGLTPADIKDVLDSLDLPESDTASLAGVANTIYHTVLEHDAELLELNPLAKTASGEFVAADARMSIDDNALFRHKELAERSPDRDEDTPLEIEARELGLAYVDLDGDIGIIGNGAGLVMATLDLVEVFGGKPANFLDIGGGAQTEIIKNGVKLVMGKPSVRAVVVNILGGITRCDLVAEGVVQGLAEAAEKKPVAVRMMGTNEQEGEKILREAGIGSYPNMEDAVKALLAGQDS